MGCACSTYGERRGAYRVLVGKPEGKRPLERPRRRWEGYFKINLQVVGCGVDWINLAHFMDSWKILVTVVTNRRVQYNTRNFCLAENLLACQEVLCYMKLVNQPVSQSFS